ncbi:MAG: NUDIX hydrolase [Sphingomonadales bacterium]|jgi:ADP-ribose pyrophosphatase
MKELWRGTYLRAMQDGHWEYVDRHKGRFAAAILAITENAEIVLVEQFRIPIQSSLWELPAGLVGDEEEISNEGAQSAAERELWEETGYRARRWQHLGQVAVSPGMVSELTDIFLASGLSKDGPGGGTASEDIKVHLLPLSEVESWIETQRKNRRPIDMKLVAALGLLNASPPRL